MEPTLILSIPLIILLCIFENAHTVPVFKPIFKITLKANRTVDNHLVERFLHKEVIAKETLTVSMCYSIYKRDASPYKLKKCSLEYYDRAGHRKDAQPIASEQFVDENGDFTQTRHVIAKVLRNYSEDLNCQDFIVNIFKPRDDSDIKYINFKCSFHNSTSSQGCNPCIEESETFKINQNKAAPYSSGVVGSGDGPRDAQEEDVKSSGFPHVIFWPVLIVVLLLIGLIALFLVWRRKQVQNRRQDAQTTASQKPKPIPKEENI